MFCGLDRPSRAICAACPVRFRSYGRLSFRRTMPFFWAKKMRPWGLFGNPMATVFFFGRLLKIFNNNQTWLAPFVMAISSGLSMIELSVLRNTKKSFGSSGSGRWSPMPCRPCSTKFANERKSPMPCWVQHSSGFLDKGQLETGSFLRNTCGESKRYLSWFTIRLYKNRLCP